MNTIPFRARIALLTCALIAATSAVADPPAGQPPATPPQAAQPPSPPASKAIPVPDLPVIKTTDLGEGLVVEDMKIGEGAEVKAGAGVVMHYHGTLKADPTKVFDSSFSRGEPIVYPLTQLVQGWQRGVPGMRIGGIRRLTVPSKLGYGEAGREPMIPKNADLVFVIQLLDAVTYEDLKVGDGDTVLPNAVCVTAHTVKTADGKEVEVATKEKPGVWIPNELPGLEGMKVGGRRKINLPAQFNNPDRRIAGNRPIGVSVTVEVELINVRNLGR